MIQLILFTIFIAFLLIFFEEEITTYIAKFSRPQRRSGSQTGNMSIICTICQDFLTERPEGLTSHSELEAIATRCGHLYHAFCIENWFGSQGRHECPICKASVDRSSFLPIYPSGDEQSGEIAAKMKKAVIDSEDNVMLKGELNQFSLILEEMGQNLQEEKAAHDQLKFEYVQKLSEVDELQRQCEENAKLKDECEKNWMEVIDKTSHERNEALERIDKLERSVDTQKLEMDKRHKEKVAELYLTNSNLQYLNDEYSSQIEELKKECKLKDLKQINAEDGTLKSVESETQTDDKDLLTLRSRWLMYKTCMKHLENELVLLESECCDIQSRQECQQPAIASSTSTGEPSEMHGDTICDLKEEIRHIAKSSADDIDEEDVAIVEVSGNGSKRILLRSMDDVVSGCSAFFADPGIDV